jgi:glyoxylase-like metal-dependent hydrolase (beta-lactamase superfamily II)
VRELPHLLISKIAVGPLDNNAYLLRCRSTGEQLLIDAAAEPEVLLDLVGDSGLATIVTTHSRSVAHPLDAEVLGDLVDETVIDNDVLTVGECALRVIHLPGHTPGSIALIYDDPLGHPHVFTGDSLFPGGVGKTTHDEQFTSLFTAVTGRLFHQLPDETWVYPGHGNDTTLGIERPSLPEWEARRW